jgi:hypothetical protein
MRACAKAYGWSPKKGSAQYRFGADQTVSQRLACEDCKKPSTIPSNIVVQLLPHRSLA